MKSSRGQYVKTSMLRPCLHTILAHCGVVMPLRGWFLTLQKSRGRWAMMTRGMEAGIIAQTGPSASPTDDWAPTEGKKRKLEKSFRVSTRAFSSNLGTRVVCSSRGRLRVRDREVWGVTGERRKGKPPLRAGPVKARRTSEASKNLFCRMRTLPHRGRPYLYRNPEPLRPCLRPHPPRIWSRLLSTRHLQRRRSSSHFCGEMHHRRLRDAGAAMARCVSP